MNVTTRLDAADLRQIADPAELRRIIREGGYAGRTGGLALGRVQANLVILPREHADDFLRFCQRNPKPCPLLAVSEPGDPTLPELGEGIDVRSDLPSYNVFRDGELAGEVTDVRDLWCDDFVAFALGCSFSFEEAIMAAGVPLPGNGGVTRIYDTSIDAAPAGPFRGRLVVSMRPFTPANAIRAIQITSRFPGVHGAPIHIGKPEQIGIRDLVEDDYNGAGPIPADQIPLFWACGITPQRALAQARLPLAISHTPGHMLITDRLNASLAVF
ncbi:MAG: putative hydro-lyase [Acetobacterales bacterium]